MSGLIILLNRVEYNVPVISNCHSSSTLSACGMIPARVLACREYPLILHNLIQLRYSMADFSV